MKKHAMLSAAGRDRIGVVDDLGAALRERNLRIRESRMTSLGGRFSVIVELCGENDDVAHLRRDLPGLGRDLGFELELDDFEMRGPAARRQQLVIESFTAKPAALNEVTRLLKRRNVNIDELRTDTSAGPFECDVTFRMVVHATVPATVAVDDLTRELRELERERKVDIVIRTPEKETGSPVGG